MHPSLHPRVINDHFLFNRRNYDIQCYDIYNQFIEPGSNWQSSKPSLNKSIPIRFIRVKVCIATYDKSISSSLFSLWDREADPPAHRLGKNTNVNTLTFLAGYLFAGTVKHEVLSAELRERGLGGTFSRPHTSVFAIVTNDPTLSAVQGPKGP